MKKDIHPKYEEITKRIRKAAQSSKHLDTRDCAILVALDLCDDRNKVQKKNKDIVGKADKIIQNTNELSKSCKEYKERLAEAINENTSLTRRIRVLEEQLRVLSKENGELKNQLEKCGKLEEVEKALQDDKTEKAKNGFELKQYSLFDKDDKNKNDIHKTDPPAGSCCHGADRHRDDSHPLLHESHRCCRRRRGHGFGWLHCRR